MHLMRHINPYQASNQQNTPENHQIHAYDAWNNYAFFFLKKSLLFSKLHLFDQK